MGHRIFPVAALLLWSACTAPQSVPPPYAAREVVEIARYEVTDDGEQLGFLIEPEIQDPAGPVRLYRVENVHGQWVGHASDIRRFSRRVPFRDDEEDLGVHSMASGLALLFERPESVDVSREPWTPNRTDAVEAAARKDRSKERP